VLEDVSRAVLAAIVALTPDLAAAVRAVRHPEALIATGGLGYAPFLDAVMRYTDDPREEETLRLPAQTPC
jgi:hypothetical protein